MSPEEKQRMIHIRIDNGVHKELRKVAAEYDLTIQEIVSGAVEEKIEESEIEFQLEKRRARLERKRMELERKMLERYEPLREKMESEIEVALSDMPDLDDFESQIQEAVMAKLVTIEKSVERISEQLAELLNALENNE